MELIGIMSVIAIIVGLLLPRVLGTIDDAEVVHAVVGLKSLGTGVTGHYRKWMTFRKADGTAYAAEDYPVEDFERTLVAGGLLDDPIQFKIGNELMGTDGDGVMEPGEDGSRLRLLDISGVRRGDRVEAGDTDQSGTYRLKPLPGGQTPVGKTAESREDAGVDVIGQYLVEAVIPGVEIAVAEEVNARIDGLETGVGRNEWGLGSANAYGTRTADYVGKVKWELTSGSKVTLFIYIAHN